MSSSLACLTLAPVNFAATEDAALFGAYRDWCRFNDERTELMGRIGFADKEDMPADICDAVVILAEKIENTEDMLAKLPAKTLGGLAAKGRIAPYCMNMDEFMPSVLNDLEALCGA